MTRVLMAIPMAWMLTVSPAVAIASDPEIKIVRDGSRAIVTVQAGTFTLMQTLTRTAVDLRLAEGADILRLSADLDGRVVVTRGHQKRVFTMQSATSEDQASLGAMLSDSPALAAFDRLLQSSWGQTSKAALFTSTREVLRVLQGDYRSDTVTAAARPVTPSMTLLRVGQRSPSQCWDTYARDVIHFTYELQSCLNSASYQWWNPLATAWCSYEYNLKSSLSAVWLLDCYGVPV